MRLPVFLVRPRPRKPRSNAIVRRLACSIAWKLSFSVSLRVELPFPQFTQLHSLTCVQLRLIAILGNRGYQFPWFALGLSVQLSMTPENRKSYHDQFTMYSRCRMYKKFLRMIEDIFLYKELIIIYIGKFKNQVWTMYTDTWTEKCSIQFLLLSTYRAFAIC
jgi:hypothetical protein